MLHLFRPSLPLLYDFHFVLISGVDFPFLGIPFSEVLEIRDYFVKTIRPFCFYSVTLHSEALL